jgi:Protein of unknown function (DUF2785)
MTILVLAAALLAVPGPLRRQQPAPGSDWIALARGGFVIPNGRTALDLLVDMNQLLASADPALRDNVAYSAAERWILRERRLSASDLRVLLQLWTRNLNDGLGTAGDDRVFKRSFSALCLSVIAAAEVSMPFLETEELQGFFDRLLDYFQRERDLRGFDPVHGWMHTVAHTSDTLKFLSRSPKLAAGSGARLLAAVRAKIESHDAVFTWGENDRMALALQSAVRRPDADAAALTEWTQYWVKAHQALWANGPQVDPRRFARVENAAQVMRSLHAALAMDSAPTPTGEAARQTLIAALARMR